VITNTVLLCNICHILYLKQLILRDIQVQEFLQCTFFSDMIILMCITNTAYVVSMLEKYCIRCILFLYWKNKHLLTYLFTYLHSLRTQQPSTTWTHDICYITHMTHMQHDIHAAWHTCNLTHLQHDTYATWHICNMTDL